MSLILGVSGLYHDSAASLVNDGEIIAAAQEERFTRKKHDARFPDAAINYCLSILKGEKLDALAFYEDPILSFDRVFKNTIEMAPATEGVWLDTISAQFAHKFQLANKLRDLLPGDVDDTALFVDHHISHAASAFYPSPFENAAILVVDGIGEWASTTIAAGNQTSIDVLQQIHYPHSLGLLYSAFTYHCGLKVDSGEYKLMGLAPFGHPIYVDKIREYLIDVKPDGSFRLNTEYFGYLDSRVSTNEKFAKLFGCPHRDPETKISLVYMDLAASIQEVLEEVMIGLARCALKEIGTNRLCLAGGVALNCVANSKLIKRISELEDIWIQPASGDAGGSLGAALHVAHQRFGAPRHRGVSRGNDGQNGSLLGPQYKRSHILSELETAGVQFQLVDNDYVLNEQIAKELDSGMIIGRFDGAMEFGPRALGNRSILADARREDNQSRINLKIKLRESWRPFAPIVLEEYADLYFDLDVGSPYMLLVSELKQKHRLPVEWGSFRTDEPDMIKLLNQKRSSLPAITHVDYSARVQTVNHESNLRLYSLMTAFYNRTGCPVLVNTSFNVRGEPIVCTPQDALRCFFNTGIDILVIENFVIYKSEQPACLRALEGSMSYERD